MLDKAQLGIGFRYPKLILQKFPTKNVAIVPNFLKWPLKVQNNGSQQKKKYIL